MEIFELFSIQALTRVENARYGSFFTNGDALFFLDQLTARVMEFDLELCPVRIHNTARIYKGICFDPADCCYWACCGGCNTTVYRLDLNFVEMDHAVYGDCICTHGAVKSIACLPACGALLLTYSKKVVEVDKSTLCETGVRWEEPCAAYRCCLPTGCWDYCVVARGGGEQIHISCGAGRQVRAFLPQGHRVLGLAELHCGGGHIAILTVKRGRYYSVLRGVLMDYSGHGTGEACRDREQGHTCPPPGPTAGDCRYGDQHGHQESGGCRDQYGRHHPRIPHCGCRGRGSGWEEVEGGCAGIIESIALEQTAISHILNAEGEKIQKAVAIAQTPGELLCVNDSVFHMVTKLIQLEQVLHAKLETACGLLRKG